jgi:hypothetical protein
MTIHLSKKILVALPLLVGALAAAVWGGGALASSNTDPSGLAVCASNSGALTAVPAGTTACNKNQTEYDLVTSDTVASLTSQVTTLEGEVSTLQGNVSALQTLLTGVTRPDANTLQFSGMNLQVVNGTGQTDGTPNGLGNLILGYNLGPAAGKTGSHDLVIGDNNTYNSTSGIVSGINNTLSGKYALASGYANTASGFGSFASGENNTAGSEDSFATGNKDTASGFDSFASGEQNTASGPSSFANGIVNTASGFDSFASGDGTTASGFDSFANGELNTASGSDSFVAGGSQEPTAGPGTCAYVLTTLFGSC